MFTSRPLKTALAVVTVTFLIGCKSDADRADEYFASGQELIASGDIDRALVQFRNVFEFDATHRPTRMMMAAMFLEQNNVRGAYQQYLTLVEQFPDDFEALRNLAELAFAISNWDEFERHGSTTITLSPDEPRVKAIDLGLKYRVAVLEEDDLARQALVAPTEALLADLPESQILNNLLIDSYIRDGSPAKALSRLDVMLAANPNDRQLNTRRIALLAQMQDVTGLETHLRDMVERFPGDTETQSMLLRFYLSQNQVEQAEAFLRDISDPAAEDIGLYVSLIQFVREVRGDEATRVEIERAIAVNPNPNPFKAMLAMLDFQAGEQDKAISDMEAILSASAETPDVDVSSIKVTLARMLANTGNQVGARRLIEEVLAGGNDNVDALKMQAAWQIQSDDTDGAISNLRLALDTAPEDVQAMNLMYEAYMRTGEADLARDFLALAVDASGNAPAASVRYAQVLMQEERFLPAEDVLLPSLRLNPGNLELLSALGSLYLQLEDIPRATQVIDTLERLDTDRSRAVATQLQAEVLNRESGEAEALEFLEGLAQGEGADLQSQLVLMRARMSTGDYGAALQMATDLVAQNPGNLGLKQALAQTQVATGDLAGAEASLREVTTAAPAEAANAWLQLSRLLARQGKTDESTAVIDEALVATNDNPNVLWAKASLLEQGGDYDGAIAIYETLYEQNSGSVVVANNLASMLTVYRNDPASLERAWVIARRLRDADMPAMQDTYGWIAFKRGEIETSLPYLESAAAGLPNDPTVQVNLGLNYAALGRNDEALEQLQKAVDLAGPADTRERIQEARAEIARLRSLTEN